MTDASENVVDQEKLVQFNKILFTNYIATSIASFGESQGMQELMDFLDLNCGAVPEGDFYQVIDLAAVDQFLNLYTNIAESRLAFAVTQVMKLGEGVITPIKQFCYKFGKENISVPQLESLEQTFSTMKYLILDENPYEILCSEINYNEEGETKEICWKENSSFHSKIWKKHEGNLELCYLIRENFIKGILSNSNFDYCIDRISESEVVQRIFLKKEAL